MCVEGNFCFFVFVAVIIAASLLGPSAVAVDVGQKTQCELVATKAALENQNTIVNTTVKNLIGTWLSEGCEIRPGPEFVLRSYTFKPDGTYRVIQHRYWDDSCSSPKMTIVSHGLIRLEKNSLLNPGGAIGYVRPINITVTPQDVKAVKELETMVATECPENNWKSWRRYEEHTIYETENHMTNLPYYNFPSYPQIFSTPNHNSLNSQRYIPQSSGHISCLGSLKWAFSELKLLKVQFRPVLDYNFASSKQRSARNELLLGDIHSRAEQREHYTPTSFQQPLLKFMKDEELSVTINGKGYTVRNVCNICSNLYAGDKSPPHLLEKPHLPPYIWGEWTSVRCETRPMGLYLTRTFTFFSDNSKWVGEHKFYQDPFCSVPKFVITASGEFLFTTPNNFLGGSTNIDFKIEGASLTIYNKRMTHQMRMFNSCGLEQWEAGVAQELSASNGCLQLGIMIPSVQYDVVKIEMNYQGSCLLYLGQADTDNMPRSANDRPTAFQEALVKCGDAHKDSLDDSFYSDDYFSSKGNMMCFMNVQLLIVILLSM